MRGGSVGARLVEDLFGDVVEAHFAADGRQARDHDFAEVALDVVSVARISPDARLKGDMDDGTHSFAYPIPPIVQIAVSHAEKALSAAMYLQAFAYSPVANPSSHIRAACMTINRELSS